MGILLTILAATLSIIFYPIALVYSLFRYSKFKYISKHYFNIAIAIDQAGGVVCQYLLNDIMIKKGGAQFGNPDSSISSIIGKNHESNTLTIFGKGLYHLLDSLQSNHAENAIEKEETDQIK